MGLNNWLRRRMKNSYCLKDWISSLMSLIFSLESDFFCLLMQSTSSWLWFCSLSIGILSKGGGDGGVLVFNPIWFYQDFFGSNFIVDSWFHGFFFKHTQCNVFLSAALFYPNSIDKTKITHMLSLRTIQYPKVSHLGGIMPLLVYSLR